MSAFIPAQTVRVCDDAPSTGPSRHGWHAIEPYLACPRRYAFQYVEGYEPPPSEAMARGSLFHVGRMHYFGHQMGAPWARDPFAAMLDAGEDIAYTYEVVAPALRYWIDRQRANAFRVLDVEREFEIRVGPFDYTARLDTVIEVGGRAYVDEAKTGTELRSHREFQRSGQILGQAVVGILSFEEEYRLPYGGVYLDQVRLGEQNDHRFKILSLARDELRRWPRVALFWLSQIREARGKFGSDAFDWPANYTACVSRWGTCPFYEACQSGRHMVAHFPRSEMSNRVHQGGSAFDTGSSARERRRGS